MPKRILRSVMMKNQRPYSRQKSGGLYEKLFAILTTISGRNFGSKREAKKEQFGQSVAHFHFSTAQHISFLCLFLKNVEIFSRTPTFIIESIQLTSASDLTLTPFFSSLNPAFHAPRYRYNESASFVPEQDRRTL